MLDQKIEVALNKMWEAAKKTTNQFHSANTKVNHLQSQFHFLENTIQQKNNEIALLSDRIAKLEVTINEKNERITSQYTEIDNLMKQQEKFSDIETTYLSILNQNRELTLELDNASSCRMELDNLKLEHNSISSKLMNNTAELNDYKAKFAAAQRELNDFSFAKKELAGLKHEIINRDEQISSLKVQLSESQSININNSSKINQLKYELDVSIAKNIEFSTEIANFKSNMDVLFSQYEIEKLNLQSIITNLHNDNAEASYQKAFVENQLKDIEKQIYKSTIIDSDALLNYEKTITEIQAQNKKLLVELNTELNNQLETLVISEQIEAIDDNNDNIYAINTDISELIQENERLVKLISDLSDKIESIESTNKELLAQNERLTREFSSTDNDLHKIQKLYKAFAKLEQTNTDQSKTIKELQEQLNEYKQRVFEADSLFAVENVRAVVEANTKAKPKPIKEIDNSESKGDDILVGKLESFLLKLEQKL